MCSLFVCGYADARGRLDPPPSCSSLPILGEKDIVCSPRVPLVFQSNRCRFDAAEDDSNFKGHRGIPQSSAPNPKQKVQGRATMLLMSGEHHGRHMWPCELEIKTPDAQKTKREELLSTTISTLGQALGRKNTLTQGEWWWRRQEENCFVWLHPSLSLSFTDAPWLPRHSYD